MLRPAVHADARGLGTRTDSCRESTENPVRRFSTGHRTVGRASDQLRNGLSARIGQINAQVFLVSQCYRPEFLTFIGNRPKFSSLRYEFLHCFF
jgi:hypothetical protein